MAAVVPFLQVLASMLHGAAARVSTGPLATAAVEAARRGFFRSIGHIIVVIVVVFVLLGLVLGVGLTRLFRRR